MAQQIVVLLVGRRRKSSERETFHPLDGRAAVTSRAPTAQLPIPVAVAGTKTCTQRGCQKQFKFNVALNTSTETIRTIRDCGPRTSISTFTHLLSSEIFQLCFTSTETIRTIRDGDPRTAISTFHTVLEL